MYSKSFVVCEMEEREWRGKSRRTSFYIIVDRLVVSLCVFPEILAQESRSPVLGMVLSFELFHAGDRLCSLEMVER